MINSYRFFANKIIKKVNIRSNSGYRTVDHQLNTIFSKWISEPDKELERLRKIPVIDERVLTLETDRNDLGGNNLVNRFQKIAFGRAIETYNTLKESHYAFHHGQAGLNFLPLNTLMKKIITKETVDSYSGFRTVLRSGFNSYYGDPKFSTTENCKKLINWRKATDNHYKGALISADAYFLSREFAESALDFFLNPWDRERETVGKSINEILTYYIVDPILREQIFNELKLINIKSEIRGILYGIYVEKKYFDEYGYLSGSCGIPLELCRQFYPDLKESSNNHVLLEQLQTESLPGKRYPQIRLLANKLNSDRVKIVVFPTVLDESYFKFSQDINELVHKYFKHFRRAEQKEKATQSSTNSDFSKISVGSGSFSR